MRKQAFFVLFFLSIVVAVAQSGGRVPRKAPGAAKPECAQGAICFFGEVQEGKEFRRKINDDLDFVLTGGSGIAIVPRHPDDKNCDELDRRTGSGDLATRVQLCHQLCGISECVGPASNRFVAR